MSNLKDNSKLKLLKSDDYNTLPLMKNENLKGEIAKSISTGICTIPEDLVEHFGITYEQSITLLSDPSFLSLVANYSKAKLNLLFHSKAVAKLGEIIEDDDPKIAIQAIKLSAQLSNNLKSTGTDVNINLNLENLVKETEKNISPFIDLEKVS